MLMTAQKNRTDLNNIVLNGKRIAITHLDDYVVMIVENYASKEVAQIPVYIPYTTWKEDWETPAFEYVETSGYLDSTETAPHEFEYRIVATDIVPSDTLTTKYMKPTNELECIAYLAQDPRVMTDVHPYLTILYLGTGSNLENGVFSGERFKFDISLLRKNTDLARNLKTGDIVKVKATINQSDEHGIQIIGKHLVQVENAPEKNPDENSLGSIFMMHYV